MILNIEKKKLGEAVGHVSRFAQRSGTLPILSGILILGGEDGITLRATNLETSIDLKVDGEVKSSGIAALPASTLREITSSFSGSGMITLEQTGDVLTISGDTTKSQLKTLPHDDFPVLPPPESPKTTFSINGSVFRDLIASVVACASTSTVRPELASVLISVEGGTLKAVATDSFRLAEKKIQGFSKLSPLSILIPGKNALEIIQTIPEEECTVLIDEHTAGVTWKGGTIVTRLVNVSYPDYTQIIPKTFVSEAVVLRKDFEAALRRTAVFSDSFQKVRLHFDIGEKRLVLSARNTDIGESRETLPAAISGEQVELSFNHRYLGTPLSLITSESITLSPSGIGRPLVIRGVGDHSFLYLVMPMNQ